MTGKAASFFSVENLNLLGKKSDVMVGIAIITIVAMLVIPIPTFLLDFFMAVSIMLGLLILMIVMYVGKAHEFSVFPALLLVTTVFRLALNVSSTRLILLQGASFDGKIVRSFGNFVVGGSYIVGFIVFIILVAVQFLVITKGATRTAEVAARFALDAMPGKQMSIDSDLSSGLINEDEARRRRAELSQETDFYGSMDGASKFIQGDVKVGIVITVINIIGGFITGIVIRNESFDVALNTYTLLSIGDGLVSQIPSLLITTATGIIVTRAATDNKNLGDEIGQQLLTFQPKALYVTSAALGCAVLIPGFPKVALILLSSGLASLGYVLSKARKEERAEQELKQVKDTPKAGSEPPPLVDPLAVEIGYNLIPLVDPEQGGTLLERIMNIRRRSALDMGLIVPPIRIRDNMELEPQVYSILIKGVEIGRGILQVGKLMAMNSGTVESKIEGDEFVEPAFGQNAIWIEGDKQSTAESRGYTVVDCPTMVATHLTEIIKRYAYDILGRQEVKQLVDNLKSEYPAVVAEVEEKKLTLGSIQKVLQNLLRERVSIRNMLTIMETLATYADSLRGNSDFLTEYVRVALSRQITADYIDGSNMLNVITVDPDIESAVRDAIHDDPVDGQIVALDPDSHSVILKALTDAVNRAKLAEHQPVFLVSPVVRRAVFTLLEREMTQPIVLSYSEINKNIRINVVISALLPAAV
ncbi:MAG: flagellar biosynthesis protein FlhA [Spirochaetia bacterium]|jgi:flagellar biosynthesis protein FlhA|nr:flagellar biosynthesis protein FlhA [Spirochaetia bacterium]